ncbi:MAG: hypothetical protein MR357_04705, partial [Anaeroplasma sp.]|nr:hypothetical protein [Anaeroplasma sp.]
MTILEYYVEKQKDLSWVKKFQSTAGSEKGKTFSYINTNFRSLDSFFEQLYLFKSKDGLRRSEWNSFQNNGQEKDKHRVINLQNAGLVVLDHDTYRITAKGHEVLRIKDNEDLSDKDKWILLLLLVLDYKNDTRSLDIIRSVAELTEQLNNCGIDTESIISMLKKSVYYKDKNVLFKSDIFWIISFAYDSEFINLYLSATSEEKRELADYVILCSVNKKTKDCIAHKYISGGAYTGTTFNDDINVILAILIMLLIKDN